MKETKKDIVKLRLTPEEKELFKEWCEERGCTMSEFLRDYINRTISQKEVK